MPYKDKSKQNEAMRKIQQEQRRLARIAKELLGIPTDKRKKKDDF